MINDRLCNLFIDLVEISSPTFEELRLAEYIISYIEKLGYTYTMDNSMGKTNSNTGNIIIDVDGSLNKPKILFAAHMDTLKPCLNVNAIREANIIRTTSDTILGADDKAGIALLLELLTQLKESNDNHAPFQIVFSVAEEVGMYGSTYLDYSLIDAQEAIVLDTGGPIGRIVQASYAHQEIKFKINGKMAHAGSSPSDGISAIMIGSRAINNMKLLQVNDYVTANIGSFNGGIATNIVCDEVKITCEARALNQSDLDKQSSHMIDCVKEACTYFGGDFEYQIFQSNKSFNININEPFIQKLVDEFKLFNIEASYITTAGGSDANIFNQNNIKAINLGLAYYKNHTTNEYQDIEQLSILTKIIYNYLTKA